MLEHSERISQLGRLATRSDGPWTVLEIPPAPAGRDLRPDIALAAGQRRHLVQRRGQRTVAGRRCQVYRARGALTTGALARQRPTGRDHVEFCVARGAIVVDQREVADGRVIRTARATSVSTARVADVPPTPAAEVLSVEAGGGKTTPVDAGVRPPFDRFYVPEQPPAGFVSGGRFAVVPPGLSGETSIIADVYTRGVDFVIVDQGATRGGAPPFDADRPTTGADLGALGQGEIVLDLRANEVRVQLPDNGFLRVIGTQPPEQLVRLARSLRLQPKEQL